VIIVNYANPDMVGHTGDLQAGIKAMKVLDEQLGRIFDFVQSGRASMILTADHGNIEVVGELVDEPGRVDTEHNPNPVPLVLLSSHQVEQEAFGEVQEVLGLDSVVSSHSLSLVDAKKVSDSDLKTLTRVPLYMVGKMFLKLIGCVSSE
jgi:bisphosphoglycerate-independent phosphoglycerate mutase (AlkP superfamily)